jgi:hypothetical protein
LINILQRNRSNTLRRVPHDKALAGESHRPVFIRPQTGAYPSPFFAPTTAKPTAAKRTSYATMPFSSPLPPRAPDVDGRTGQPNHVYQLPLAFFHPPAFNSWPSTDLRLQNPWTSSRPNSISFHRRWHLPAGSATSARRHVSSFVSSPVYMFLFLLLCSALSSTQLI